MYKIAVVGDRDSIYGFAALGLDIYDITDEENIGKKFKSIADSKYSVIYITEELAAKLEKEIDSYKDAEIPAIIPIPGIKGNNGIGISNVKKFVEKAVGSDIIFND